MLNPPLHYLDAVLGVLDSLLSAGLYDEMPFFIAKLHRLTESDYPQEFVRKVLAYIYIYDSFRLINCGAFADAQELYKLHEETLFRKLSQQKLDVQLLLQLNLVVLHLVCGRGGEAVRFRRKRNQIHTPQYRYRKQLGRKTCFQVCTPLSAAREPAGEGPPVGTAVRCGAGSCGR